MSRFFAARLSGLVPYVPGEQPRDAQFIKLNTNESPFPPSPAVQRLLASPRPETALQLYPDPQMTALGEAFANSCGVSPQNVFCANGSDEALAFAFLAFGEKGVAFADITYGFYRVWAELFSLDAKIVPLQDDFSIDPADYMTGNEMVVIANPNAPTGMAMSVSDIERIVRANPDRVVVVDEAYVDFGAQSCVGLTKTYENLLVVQTFSKSRSLAGARLGFAVGSCALIGDLETLKFSFNPYNISRTSAAAGIAALGDDAYFQYCNTEIIRVRRATARSLSALGFRVLPSCANFLFAKPPGISGAQYYQALRKNGILVRHFEGKRIADFVRISIGTDRQMQTLVDITKNILREVHA